MFKQVQRRFRKMGKYIEDAKELLTYVGGRTNISAVT